MNRFRLAALAGAIAGAVAVSIAGSTAAAPTGIEALRAQCTGVFGPLGNGDAKVAACNALIASGQLDDDALALALANRGEGYAIGKHFDQAIADFDKALAGLAHGAHTFDIAEIHDARGYAYLAQGRFVAALPDFTRAIALDANSGAAYAGRARAWGGLGFATRDRDDDTAAIALVPSMADAYAGRGAAEYEIGDPAGTVADMDYAIRLRSDTSFVRYYRGLANIALGKFDLALQDFDRALSLTPGDANTTAARAQARTLAVQQAQRLAAPVPAAPGPSADGTALSRAAGTTHDCAALYPRISASLFEAGDVILRYDVDTNGTVGNVLLLQSSGSERLDRAALACVAGLWRNLPARRGGQPVASPGHKVSIQFVQNHDPSDAAGDLVTRGESFAAIGNDAAALADYDRALALDPKYEAALYRRGLSEYVLGRFAPAVADLESALALSPGDKAASDARDVAKAALADPN